MPQTATVTRTSTTRRNHQFLDDSRAFKRIYRASRHSWRDGDNPLQTYFSVGRDVLGEEISEAGNLFGVEIEFDMRTHESVSLLAVDLHEAGLLNHPSQNGYHAGTLNTRNWRFEYDATVSGGEVISPILRDNSDSWNTLRGVLSQILNRGGRAEGTNVGSHVSIDSSALSSEQVERLGRIAIRFEDVMYRLATNPERARYATPEGSPLRMSTHRRRVNRYCEPLRSQSGRSLTGSMHRGAWLNKDTGRHRFEFRIFDGTLDEAVMQTNIIIATAMVRAAMNPDLDGALEDIPERPLGWHRQQEWRTRHEGNRPRLVGEDWMKDTLAIRQFVDLMFDNTVDKERVITLYALNDWSFARRRRGYPSAYRTQYN